MVWGTLEPTHFKKGLPWTKHFFSRLCAGSRLSEFETLLWHILLFSQSPRKIDSLRLFICHKFPSHLFPTETNLTCSGFGKGVPYEWWEQQPSVLIMRLKFTQIFNPMKDNQYVDWIFTLSNQSWQHCNISLRTLKLLSRTLARVFCDCLHSHPLGKE